ncbi:MAG: hypothetical protein WD355_03045 [Balneolaceae bacterium]
MVKTTHLFALIITFCFFITSCVSAQTTETTTGADSGEPEGVQSYDKTYIAPTPENPAGTGTTVYIDAAHNNFHTADNRFKPFADLIRNDGYLVESFDHLFTSESLADVDILVISNPVNDSNTPEENWIAPIESAFTADEIDVLVDWVYEGGSLMLIADHFPFPGAVEELAARFGFQVDNGYNFDPHYYSDLRDQFFELPVIKDIQAGTADPNSEETQGRIFAQAAPLFIALGAQVNSLNFWAPYASPADSLFAEGDGTVTNPLQSYGEPENNFLAPVPYITTFTGQSFTYVDQPGLTFCPLMVMGNGTYTVLTEAQDAYFGPDVNSSNSNMLTSLLTTGDVPDFIVPVTDSTGKLQGATVESGEGKVAFFGEAGMFTAQIAADGVTKMGMNNPAASHNWQFALNVVRYLDGYLAFDCIPVR